MPPTLLPGSVDTNNKFEDLSGVNAAAYVNPYDAMIEACKDDPALIQARYATHRTTRNRQQKAKLLSPEFSGLNIDAILEKLEDPTKEPGFIDPRHCLVFWARPPAHIRSLAGQIQQKLLAIAPHLWLMPLDNMHLTALEITHSLTSPEITAIRDNLGSSTVEKMTDYTFDHRARLIKPMVSYDGAALALSFLPAAGEGLPSAGREKRDDEFTYHHLRRDLFNLAKDRVSVDSRYVVPSSHITLARFLHQADHDTPTKMSRFISQIEEINRWLEDAFWPAKGRERVEQGEWLVGQGKGLDFREGTLWYGGGQTVRIGRGFE